MPTGEGRKVAKFTKNFPFLRIVSHYSVLSGGQDVMKVILEGNMVN